MTTLTRTHGRAAAGRKQQRISEPKPGSSAGGARGRPVEADDLLRFQMLGEAQVSPDGSQVLFSHKVAGEKNEYDANLWIAPADGAAEPRPFTTGKRDGHGRWSPDGGRIAFISGRENKRRPQIYTVPSTGGEARRLTRFPEGVLSDLKWSPDGRFLAVRFREQDTQWTEEAEKARKDTGASEPPRVLDDWWYRLDGDGYFNAQRHHLYLVDAATGEHRQVYDEDTLGYFDYDFTPDSRTIILATNRDPKAMIRPWETELLRLDVKTGRVKPVPNLPRCIKGCVAISPDGKTIAWVGREGEDDLYSTENLHLFVSDAVKGGARNLTEDEDYCLMASPISDVSEVQFGAKIQWSRDGKRIFMQVGWHGEMHVASVPATGGKIAFHTSGCCVHQMGNLSEDGRLMALTRGTSTRLDEVDVASVSNGAFRTRQLTNLNGPLLDSLQLAEPEEHWITSADGNPVQVWILKPAGYSAKKKYPAILEIHGGPHAQYGVGLFHEFQLLAANGYMVVFSNPRGSKGYGRDHCAAIRGCWGTADWVDIQAVIEFMQSRKDVDTKRMGVMGGSYGGYMTNWVIGHTDVFAGAITDRCVSNLVSMFGNSDHVEAPDRYWNANSWDRPEKLWEHSPIRHLGNAKTPTLIIHSEGDLRCNVEQAEQVFTVLKLNDVPTRFVRYPRSTSHGMSRCGPPDLRLHRLGQILEWWQRWLGPKRGSRKRSTRRARARTSRR